MPHANNRTLAIRSLNAVRTIHVPTYLASRAMFESLASDTSSTWGTHVSPYKYSLRKYGRYYSSLAFKGFTEKGERTYREFHIPSPSTLLAEASALSELAEAEGFRKPENVFSYRWPQSLECPYNFEHFINGFRSRQEKVSFLSAKASGTRVISLDLKTFYPSINREEAMRHFSLKLANSQVTTVTQKNALQLAKHLVSELPGNRGIPTGPEFSHLLADCAFSSLDEVFANRFGENYLRYVDDLIFVVPSLETEATLALVRDTLASQGYQLNNDKEDYLDGMEWIQHVPQIKNRIEEDSFEALVFKIKVFLSAHPEKIEELRDSFQKLDIRIPLRRLASATGDKNFRQKLREFARGGWKILWSAYNTTTPELVSCAQRVQSKIESNLSKLLEEPLHTSGIRRRWQLQNLRYCVNRAVYILKSEDLRTLAANLSKMPEFVQFRTLVHATLDGDPRDIIYMPGATINTAGSLLRTLNRRLKIPNDLHVEMKPEVVQSISSLLAYDVIDIPEYMRSNPDIKDLRPSKLHLKAPVPPFSFLDEFRLLLSQENASTTAAFLDSRFSSHEALALEALQLDEKGYS